MLLQLEILIFFLSFFYIIYFFSEKIISSLLARKAKILERQEKRKERKKKQLDASKNPKKTLKTKKREEKVESYIAPEQSEQIREILKRAKINVERWYFDSARTLIVEWLALKKDDKSLNLLLADIYEREKKFQNAEFIYNDLLEIHGKDLYTLQRLWNIYVLRNKTKKAGNTYEEAHGHDKSNTEILDILSHIFLEEKNFKKALKYSNLYLKEKPRNIEKLWIKWYALEKMGRKWEAATTYNDLLQLQPYNSEVQERLVNLQS